jgi:uncharacterized membrane protein
MPTEPGTTVTEAPAPPRFRLGIETVSDVVFGLALEIGSLALIAKLPQSSGALLSDIGEFGFSFLLIIAVWLAYRRAVVTLPLETQWTVFVNIALLFCVSIEPFLFYVLVSTSTISDVASAAFALDMGAMMLLLSGHSWLLLDAGKKGAIGKAPADYIARLRGMVWNRAVVALIFLVSALPLFWIASPVGQWARMDLWYLGLALLVIFQAGAFVHSGRAQRPAVSGDESRGPQLQGPALHS